MLVKFHTLVKAFLNYIDNGNIFRSPFRWLYIISGIAFALFPIIVLISAIRFNLFDAPFKIVLAFLLIWIVLLIAGATSLLLWWDRKDHISKHADASTDFIVSLSFAHFIQTFGEAWAVVIGLVGTAVSLVTGIFLGGEGSYQMSRLLPFPSEIGFIGIIAFPIAGYLILIFSRFISEQIKALATIANNTKPKNII